MSFLDRLRPCRYLSPSGTEHEPFFDDLERSFERKAPVHEMPHRDTADVQDLGNAAQKYPISLYFVGPEYDREADLFYQALREHGRGKLKHPRWGDIDVLSLSVSQTEKFVEGTHAAQFQIEFIEAPDPTALAVATITAAFVRAGAAAAAGSISTGAGLPSADIVEGVKIKVKSVTLVSVAADILKVLTTVAYAVSSAMSAAQKTIERDIDTLAGDLPKLYNAIVSIYRMPAAIETGIKDKVKAFEDAIQAGVDSLEGFAVEVASLLGLTTAAAESTAYGTLSSRGDAMDAYNALTDASALALAAVEPYVTDIDSFSAVRQLCSDARARLLVESYSLPTERCMTLQGDSDQITLAFQLYKDPERYTDIIAQNHLADSQIFVVPMGTEIRWYE